MGALIDVHDRIEPLVAAAKTNPIDLAQRVSSGQFSCFVGSLTIMHYNVCVWGGGGGGDVCVRACVHVCACVCVCACVWQNYLLIEYKARCLMCGEGVLLGNDTHHDPMWIGLYHSLRSTIPACLPGPPPSPTSLKHFITTLPGA